ncbi:ClpXP protease specificity-enhancing factor [Pseudidiomarina woesei]|uniref:Stringent starvation protein B n=1 Tax=Pseudidiomarina woesei TaxID=1381080 RepID=A0A0K6H7B5_9GAMM|nr:ClpXP protease specificity-enhancing factor [Pseudidiomarina woesei]CUA86877.1 Stringent starvation protein B [Pseudidiomarina woesei]
MTPRRPYLVRAVYEWILDNQLTPHLVVDADYPGCQVPWQFVQDGQIILNISPTAVTNFVIDNHSIQFNARFSGSPHRVIVPMGAAMALYARENGAGSMFDAEPHYDNPQPVAYTEESEQPASTSTDSESQTKKPKKSSGSHLRVIK